MPIERKFLDWSQAALPAAADHLIAHYQNGNRVDLSRAIVVVPGGRAGRRLTELLVQKTDDAALSLTPPKITTEGGLPELLYLPKRPFADELTQKLAWAEALQSTPAEARSKLLPYPPAADDADRWLALGDLLRRVHLELAADGLDFGSVLAHAPRLAGLAEKQRWETLKSVQQRYLDRLDGLSLWDVQTARLEAIRRQEITTDRDLILVGAVDLNSSLRQMLDQIAGRVTALVVAPQSLANRFDEHGCLRPEAWLQAEVPLREDHIERADGPADQADSVVRWLASLGGKYRSDEIVVGLPEASLAPQIVRQLAQCEIRGRWVEGQRVADTAPYRFLAALADYDDSRKYADLARLVRHPDVEIWLNQQAAALAEPKCDWLTQLDRYQKLCLPLRLDEERLRRAAEDDRIAPPLLALQTHLAKLLPAAQDRLPLSHWSAVMRTALTVIYGGRVVVRDHVAERYLEQSLGTIAAAVDTFQQVPQALEPRVSFRQAVGLLLESISSEVMPPPADPAAIELLGWLELPLDDAPALVVTSFNEGIVPKSKTADPFLPNELRRQLALDDNDRRYARDAYALSVLAASRQNLRLIVGHRDVEGNPLAPSRLLFATEPDDVARRAVRLFSPPPPSPVRRVLAAGLPPAPKASTLTPPRLPKLAEPLDKISVTHFRTYLACPYRFYLRHVLKLEALADDGEELDGAQFGILVHDCLEHFGRDEKIRCCDQAEAIYEFLADRLSTVAAARYGTQHGRPAIRMQVEHVRRRLEAFAKVQASRAAEGWQILHSEDTEQRLDVEFIVDGVGILLRGRIDRIDWHAQSKTLLVLDYKTGDGGDDPQRVHRKATGQWIDLQLPLYRHLLARLPLEDKPASASAVQLGYFALPKDDASAGVQVAGWSDAELDSADEAAREVIRAIRREEFWPPKQPPPAFCEDLAPICHDHRLGSFCGTDEEGA